MNTSAQDIDRRSFHVFEVRGQHLLFDRATGTTSEITPFAWALLHMIEAGIPSSEAGRSGATPAGADEAGVLALFEEFERAGVFKFTAVDLNEQDRLLRRLLRHKQRRIQLLLTQGCNLGCRYCYAWRNGSNQLNTLMSWEVAKRSIDYLVERSRNRPEIQVTFFGGEPLMNWSVLEQSVLYAEEISPRVQKKFIFEVVTNGTLLEPRYVHFLAERRSLLMVSIDGWQDMHDYNRPTIGRDSAYEEIVKNALYANEYYKSKGIRPIKIRANLTDKFHDSIAVTEYLRGRGFDRVAVAPIEPLPHGNKSPSSMSEDQMEEVDLRAFEHTNDVVDRFAKGQELSPLEKELLSNFSAPMTPRTLKGVICGIGRNTQCVDNKGNVYPCHRYEGMSEFVLGNVFTGLDLDRTLRYYRMVNGNATNRCHSCWIRDYCAGGCAWLLSTASGQLVDPTERECDRRRANLERGLYFRSQLRKISPMLFQNARAELDDLEGTANVLRGRSGRKKESACGVGGCASCSSVRWCALLNEL